MFDNRPVCADACGRLMKVKKVFTWGALETTGPDLLRLFIQEAARWGFH